MSHYNNRDDDSIAQAPAVPGTEVLMDMAVCDETEKQHIHFRSLQHVEGKKGGHLLLVPQPSLTDVNDPLRWPTTKKWLVLGNGIFYAFNGAVTGPIMAAGKSKAFFDLVYLRKKRSDEFYRHASTGCGLPHQPGPLDLCERCCPNLPRRFYNNLDVSFKAWFPRQYRIVLAKKYDID